MVYPFAVPLSFVYLSVVEYKIYLDFGEKVVAAQGGLWCIRILFGLLGLLVSDRGSGWRIRLHFLFVAILVLLTHLLVDSFSVVTQFLPASPNLSENIWWTHLRVRESHFGTFFRRKKMYALFALFGARGSFLAFGVVSTALVTFRSFLAFGLGVDTASFVGGRLVGTFVLGVKVIVRFMVFGPVSATFGILNLKF